MIMKINYPDIDKLIEFHYKIIQLGLDKGEGGSFGFLGGKDKSDLNSIIEFIKNDDHYPKLEDKITHLMFSINKNHIFVDGNKRSSIYFSAYFLSLNISDNDLVKRYIRELEDITVYVADNKISKNLLGEIINSILNYEEYNEELKLKIFNSINLKW
ncbi:death-on-curing protein [Candidatus Vampirococcus lugosii]|uniref:Death-on-curing protein n=2 Tax=Candidatus Vampirococcus lugosii TaxID=2789015 RepID=A0ABS5QK55_9BACT|nr:death-on-curing protein [Candidatus Vampirococcus lugosii]